MTDQSKRNIVIIVACVILYLALFPVRLSLEPLVSRKWVIPSSTVSSLPTAEPKDIVYPIFSGKSLIYLEENGKRSLAIPDASGLSLGRDRYAQRLANGQIGLFRRNGESVTTINHIGLPYFDGKTLCVVADTGNAMSVFTEDGEFRWHFESDDIISAFCSGPKGDSFVALSDGRVFWMDGQGNIRATIRPGHGKHHAVYSLLWVESRQILAALVDVQPQSLLLLQPRIKKDGSDAKLVETKDIIIPNETRQPVVLQAELQDSVLILDQPDGIGLISMDGNEQRLVALGGTVQKLVGVNDAGIMVATTENDSGISLIGFKPDGRTLFRQKIRGHIDDIVVDRHDNIMVSSGAGLLDLDFYVR